MGQPWEDCFPQVGAETYADAAKRTRQMLPKHPTFHTFALNELIISHISLDMNNLVVVFPLSVSLVIS